MYKGDVKTKRNVQSLNEEHIIENDNMLSIQTEAWRIIFDKAQGHIVEIKNAQNVLEAPLKPNFWRAPTDNDLGNGLQKRAEIWKIITDSIHLAKFDHSFNNNLLEIITEHVYDTVFRQTTIYTIDGSGTINVAVQIDADKSLSEIPRIGMSTVLKGSFNEAEWYGRGPEENYWDRKTASFVGKYKDDVEHMNTKYVRPQENGNRSDVRWFKLINDEGQGITFTSGSLFNFSVFPFSYDELSSYGKDATKHGTEILSSGITSLNIDHLQMGVGGDNTWGAKTHDSTRRIRLSIYNRALSC